MASSSKRRRGSGEGSLYKRAADGMWVCSIELPTGPDGKRRRKVIVRKDKAEARRELTRVKKELEERGDLIVHHMTVQEWTTHWLETIHAPEVRPKTYMGNRSALAHVNAAIGNVRLDRVTPEHVRKVHRHVLSTPKKASLRGERDLPEGTEMLSDSYAKTVHNIMRLAFKSAVIEGKLAASPVENVRAPRAATSERAALSLDEAIILLGHLATRPDGAMWATYLLTGARRGEILGLEADRVGDVLDLSWQLLRISNIDKAPKDYEYRHVYKTLYLTRPKSKAGWRIVPLVEPLRSILLRHAQGRDGLLFTRPDGLPWYPDDITEAWKELLAEAGLPDNVVLHGSRHTTVDLLYEAGVPEALIQEIVGHSTRAITRGYRSRGNLKQLTDAMNQLSGLFAPKELD